VGGGGAEEGGPRGECISGGGDHGAETYRALE
jgi:hypothetical protein